MKLLTITLNTYQVVTDDEIVAPILSSDSHRGGGVAVVILRGYAQQAFGKYTESITASALKQRDYKDATDLILGGNK